jgi:hypothetical protein
VIFPMQKNAPACTVAIPSFRDDVEVPGDQDGRLVEIIRILPHQAAIGEAVAMRQGTLLLRAIAKILFGWAWRPFSGVGFLGARLLS